MAQRKNMVVIYMRDDWHRRIPIKSIPTRKSFEDWHERGQVAGIEMYRASIKWYDVNKNVFKKAWAYRDGQWVKIKKAIKPNFVFDKIAGKYNHQLFDFKLVMIKKVKVYNHPLFRMMLDSKLSQYLLFEEFMPKSILATSAGELEAAVKNITSSKIVVKPLYGSGGSGIIIDQKGKVLRSRIIYPVLVQEFVGSQGIPGFPQRNKVADLRMVFINHKLIYALSRVAKKGSLFTNFHQGAVAVLVPNKLIPKSTIKVANKIVKKLKFYPEANYSLDFIFSRSRPILLEMNTTPGFDLLREVGDERVKNKFFQEFVKAI